MCVRKCRKTCSFALTGLSLQVVEEEQLVHRGAVQQPVRQSNGGSRPKGQNVATKDHFAGEYANRLPTAFGV